MLEQRGVSAAVKVQSKKRLLQEIAAIAKSRLGLDEQSVHTALLERETLGPTGVGYGVALPHARIEGLEKVHGLFLHLETPVDFESVDRRPVDLIFVLLAPIDAGADHLKALARVSRILRSDAVCAKLRSTADPAALFAILADTDAIQAA
ncbi:MAG: PTS sugar transporter subunit IIA [Pseudomonadota bacterium]